MITLRALCSRSVAALVAASFLTGMIGASYRHNMPFVSINTFQSLSKVLLVDPAASSANADVWES